MQFLLMCRSLTYAQRSARMLERAAIGASVARAPRSISTRGCGYVVSVAGKNLSRAMEVLTQAGLRPEKIYRREPDGTIGEAAL